MHKFSITQTKNDVSGTNRRINQAQISENIDSYYINQNDDKHSWIVTLLPFIQDFSKKHSNHDLRIIDNSKLNYSWWPESAGYTEWKEFITMIESELFLPRNLVDDLKITEWEKAEIHLKSLKINLYDELELTEYRITFNKLTLPRN